MGLVQEVVPAGRALGRALQLAERIASYPQKSLLADRRSSLAGLGLPLRKGLAVEAEAAGWTGDDPELADGIRRFVEGQWEGGAAGALHP